MESFSSLEKEYQKYISEPLTQAKEIGEADIILGIPFYNETDTIGNVIKIVTEGLKNFYPQEKSVIVCVGSPEGRKALEIVDRIDLEKEKIKKIAFLLEHPSISGRGWAIRSIMEVAKVLGAEVAIFSADLFSEQEGDENRGLSPEWVKLLLDPIKKEKFDLVLPKYHRHYFDAKITHFLVSPLIAAIYGKRITEPLAAEYGISRTLIPKYLSDHTIWTGEIGQYGVDNFLITKAIVVGAKMGEVDLGVKLYRPSPGKSMLRFKGATEGIFERILADRSFWENRGNYVSSLETYGIRKDQVPPEVKINYEELIGKYRDDFNQFYYLYEKILPKEIYRHLVELADSSSDDFMLSGKWWAEISYYFLLSFAFSKELHKEDIIEALNPIFLAKLVSFAKEMEKLKSKLNGIAPQDAERLLSLEAERIISDQVEEFIREKVSFLDKWKERGKAFRPYLPKIGCWEFIPQVPLVVPQEIIAKSGKAVQAKEVYKTLIDRYRREFQEFISRKLRFEKDTSSIEILQRVMDFMLEIQKGLDELLFPGDLHTQKGTKEVVEAIFHHLPHNQTFSLKEEAAYRVVSKYPPVNLLTRFKSSSLSSLLKKYTPCDVLALASWSEERKYRRIIWEELRQTLNPSDFEYSYIKPLVVSYQEFPSLAEMKGQLALNRMTGRLVVSELPKAKGGKFPKVLYFLTIGESIAEAERFGKVWKEFSQERNFGERFINCLRGHWGRAPFSAHNIFENGNQRVLVERIKQMGVKIKAESEKEGNLPKMILSSRMEDLTDCYHLALTLSDNTFVSLSAWTWANYSFEGGHDFPTPLSARVERDWTSRDFLVEYLKAAQLGDEATVERKVIELMGEGRESEDLAHHLLGLEKESEKVLIDTVSTIHDQPAGKLKRLADGPIIEPIKKNWWESKFVFNCASVRLNNRYYILYRAVGEHSKTSYIGLAISKDGITIEERLNEPIFKPEKDYEGANCNNPELTAGCEDPRVTVIGDRIYMLYTANSGHLSQIGLASIKIDDFLSFNWKAWKRHGPTYPGFPNKDAVLFPEKFSGKYAVYHRIEPAIWLSYMDSLDCPWPSEGHKIVITPRTGMMWDGVKIGAGAQPIKTSFGWLIIYHGVDYLNVYRLGLILVSLDDPGEVLYRSPNPILEPERDYELGESKKVYWVPRVVFTCGAVPASEKEVLSADDSVLVYYGAADTVIGVAEAKVGELIPQEVRKRIGSD